MWCVCEKLSVGTQSWIRTIRRGEFRWQSTICRNSQNLRGARICSHSSRTEQDSAITHPIRWSFCRRVICHTLGNATINWRDINISVAFVISKECNGLSIWRESRKTSAPGGSATGCATPPFLSTVHNPFAYEKTMRF